LAVDYLCVNAGDAVDLLGQDIKERIADAFRGAYNSLRGEVCDPFNRRVLSATVVLEGKLRNDGRTLPLQLQVLVACNGCDGDLTDLYGFPGNDTTINYYNASDTRHRRLGLSPVAIARG
jgi:hypothetical protein